MLIRFGVGLIHFGRPTGIGGYRYDAAVTLCFGPRGDVPFPELSHHRIYRIAWNWLPDRIYQTISGIVVPETAAAFEARHLREAISGKRAYSLHSEYRPPVNSSRWTGRERRFVGFGAWRREYLSYRSTWRSKMHVYLTGSKERASPNHIVYIAPAAVVPAAECPEDWRNADGTPKQMEVKFIHGRAEVDARIGKWMVDSKQAQSTNIIRRGGAMLGHLAGMIRGS